MQKPTTIVFQVLAAGLILLGVAPAQQTSTTTTQSGQPSSTSGASTKAPAAKRTTTTAKTAALTLKTQKEKTSYALGMKIGTDLHRQGVSAALDPAITARGLKDALAGSKTLLTEDEMKTLLSQLRDQMTQQQQAKAREEAVPNRKAGEAFLAANKTKEGVVTLPSGLQYKILKEGMGPKPTLNDTVSCNYRGTLIDGKEFDSSAKHGGPASFPVGGVIKGWTEALQLMPVGSKWELFIPPDLAYGDRGAGADIGPGETLIFEVELLSIQGQKN